MNIFLTNILLKSSLFFNYHPCRRKYNISRRRGREITSNAYFLLKDDVEKGDLNRPEMTAKLLCTLETAMHRAMQEKQYSAVASNAKVLMKLIGLEAKIKS